MPTPENTLPLLSTQPLGEANTTGTPTVSKKLVAIKATKTS